MRSCIQGVCQKFKPVYVDVAKQVRLSKDIRFYAVSCAAQKEVCKEFEVESYPSLYIMDEANPKSKLLQKGISGYSAEVVLKIWLDETKLADSKVNDSAPLTDEDVENEDLKEDSHSNDTIDVKEERRTAEEDEEGGSLEVGGDEHQQSDVALGSTGTNQVGEAVGTLLDQKRLADDDEGSDVVPLAMDKDRGGQIDAPDEADGESEDNPQEESPLGSEVIQMHKARVRARIKGAQAAKEGQKDLNRWQEHLKEEKANAKNGLRSFAANRLVAKRFRRGEVASEGATNTMRAFIPGSKEFEDRKKFTLDAIRKAKGKKAAMVVEDNWSKPSKEFPFQKEVRPQKFVERVPLVKRFVAMTPEETLILDATLSFMHALRIGVYKSTWSMKSLPTPQRTALRNWFKLLRVSLPQEWSVHNLIDDLLDNFDFIAQGDTSLTKILFKHKFPRSDWSGSCGQGKLGGGFSCGFWKLLHTVTVGVAEYKGGLNLVRSSSAKDEATAFSPEAAADVIREYIANFFPCTDCATHFLARFDDCSYRRCERLHDNAETATDADWKELAKWLWEFHNEVSVRLFHEKDDFKMKQGQRSSFLKEHGPNPASGNEIQALWPTLRECITCFGDDGTWNEDAVFLNLEKTYW